MYSYDGLNIFKNGDHLTIYWPGSDSVAWEGELAFITQMHIKHSSKFEYFKTYLHKHQTGYEQLNLCGRWIHSLPYNVDLALWARIFLDDREEWRGKLTRSDS